MLALNGMRNIEYLQSLTSKEKDSLKYGRHILINKHTGSFTF